MAKEQIKIDEKYTYQNERGHVQILRHNEPWVGETRGGFAASKAWVAAAHEIESLRNEVTELRAQLGVNA